MNSTSFVPISGLYCRRIDASKIESDSIIGTEYPLISTSLYRCAIDIVRRIIPI